MTDRSNRLPNWSQMIESKSIETPATLVRFSIRAPQGAASVSSAGGHFTNPYHEESDRSKRVSFKTLGWRTVPSTLDTVESRVIEAKREKKTGGQRKWQKMFGFVHQAWWNTFSTRLEKGRFWWSLLSGFTKKQWKSSRKLQHKMFRFVHQAWSKKKKGEVEIRG